MPALTLTETVVLADVVTMYDKVESVEAPAKSITAEVNVPELKYGMENFKNEVVFPPIR